MKGETMKPIKQIKIIATLALAALFIAVLLVGPRAHAQDKGKPPPPGNQPPSSYMPVIDEPFAVVLKRDKAAKARVMAEHQKLLESRYDLSRRVDENVKMS